MLHISHALIWSSGGLFHFQSICEYIRCKKTVSLSDIICKWNDYFWIFFILIIIIIINQWLIPPRLTFRRHIIWSDLLRKYFFLFSFFCCSLIFSEIRLSPTENFMFKIYHQTWFEMCMNNKIWSERMECREQRMLFTWAILYWIL